MLTCSDATARLLKANEKTAVEDHRKRLRARVAQLQDEIIALNGFHNTLAPAALLPFEILSEIFLIYRDSERQEVAELGREPLTWVRLIHVCRRWRAAAIDCRALWSIIAFFKVEFAKMMLSLSRTAPLTVRLFGTEGKEAKMLLSDVLKQTQRLRHVDINFGDPTILEVHSILSNMSGRASRLESLSVAAYRFVKNDIPHNLLEGGAPVLKQLTIRGCDITNWSTLPFGPALTDLTISSVGHASSHPGIHDLFDYLAKLPSLRNLTLRESLPRKAPAQTLSSPPPPTSLSTLEILAIDDDMEEVIDFFSSAQLTNTKSVELCIESGCSNESISLLLATLSASWYAGMAGGVGDLEILEDDDSGGSKAAFSFRPHSSRLTLIFPSDHPSVDGLIGVYQTALDLKHLETLSIRDTTEVGAPSWETFGRLPHLEVINFFSTKVTDFISIFERQALSSDDAELRFPALAEISFDRVLFDPQQRSSGGRGRVEDVEKFIEGITWRDNLEGQLDMLRVIHCSHFFGRHYDRIRKVAPRLAVYWDGVQTTSGWEGIFG